MTSAPLTWGRVRTIFSFKVAGAPAVPGRSSRTVTPGSWIPLRLAVPVQPSERVPARVIVPVSRPAPRGVIADCPSTKNSTLPST